MAPEVANPPADSDATTPASPLVHRGRTKEQFKKVQLEQIVSRELIHSDAILVDQKHRVAVYKHMREETEDYHKVRSEYRNVFTPSRLHGPGYNGWGNGHTDGPTRLIYPVHKPRPGHRKTPRLRIKRKDMNTQADQVEELVPIRLEVDADKVKLRDTFTWNIHDRTVNTNLFAQQLVEDFGLQMPPAEHVLQQVQQQMEEQLNDFYPPVYDEEEALDPHLPYSAYKNDEMRILIVLSITIGSVVLHDKFEWEINNPMNSPEEFALSMARELSLSGEFVTSIAHCIREQCQLFIKSLYIVGHPFDGRPIDDQDLVSAMLPSPIPSIFRPAHIARAYAPDIFQITEAELEREEIAWLREQRRQKRSVNRRGGPTLPDTRDNDRPRTIRTRVVSSVIPYGADKTEPNPIYKRVGANKKRIGTRDDSEDSLEEEDSGPDSPVISVVPQGTARTRNMRGAATQAQQRMANLGRSETPEAVAHHHETRTSARRFGGPVTEESVDNDRLIVKLKISKGKLQALGQGRRIATARSSSSAQAPNPTRPQSAAAAPAVGSMGPPSTPGTQNQQLVTATTPGTAGQIGRIDAPPPPPQGQPPHVPPPPPSWLTTGLNQLLSQYSSDRFEGMMRYSSVNKETEIPCPAPPQGQPIPPDVKWMYLPRIRCHDCPGKLYTPGPGTTVENFEVHLKNRQHRERVDQRTAARGGGGGAGSGGHLQFT